MRPVTDPDLLKQLEARSPARRPVTDPSILEQLETGQKTESVGLSPAQEFQNDQPLLRTLGRGIRSVTSGLASVADLPLLAVKTAALGGGLAAENMGAPEIGRGLQRVGMLPSMADSTRALIDQATGDRLKPTGTIDKIGDFAGEMISSAAPFARGADIISKAVKGPGIKDAVSGTLNPQGYAERVFVNKRPVPRKITSEVLKKQAGSAYKAAEESGDILPASFTDEFLEKASKVKPKTVAGQLTTGRDAADDLLDRWAALSNKPLTINDIQDMDEGLSQLIDGFWKNGRLEKEGKKLFDIQTTLREMVENTDGGGTLAEARKLWAKSSRMKDIERVITRAEQGENPAQAIKTGFRTLYNNPNRIKGFSKAEREAIKKAAESGFATDLLKTFGSRLIPIASTIKGGPMGAAAGYASAALSRDAAARLQLSKANKIAEIIAKGPPVSNPPLLTNQGVAALLATTNAAGQKLLPKPEPNTKELARLLAAQ